MLELFLICYPTGTITISQQLDWMLQQRHEARAPPASQFRFRLLMFLLNMMPPVRRGKIQVACHWICTAEREVGSTEPVRCERTNYLGPAQTRKHAPVDEAYKNGRPWEAGMLLRAQGLSAHACIFVTRFYSSCRMNRCVLNAGAICVTGRPGADLAQTIRILSKWHNM